MIEVLFRVQKVNKKSGVRIKLLYQGTTDDMVLIYGNFIFKYFIHKYIIYPVRSDIMFSDTLKITDCTCFQRRYISKRLQGFALLYPSRA